MRTRLRGLLVAVWFIAAAAVGPSTQSRAGLWRSPAAR